MVFFIDEARSPRLLTNVNKKMVFFIEGFPYLLPIINIIVWFWREHLIVLQCKVSFSTGTFHFIMTTLLQ